MRKFLSICLLVLIAALPAAAQDKKESAYERVMRTGTIKAGYSVWPPYQIKDPNTGEISGVAADHMKIFANLLGLKVEWVELPGVGTEVEELKSGRCDVAVNDGPYVFSMIKFIDFADPLFYVPVHAYVRQDNKRFHKLEELNSPDVTFVGLDGDLSVSLVGLFYPKAKLRTLPATSDPSMMMTDINTGKADVAIIDPGTVHNFNKNNKPGLSAFAPDAPVAVYPIGYGAMKDDGKLLAMINSATAMMHNTNAVNPVLEKWIPEKDSYYFVAKPYEVPQ
ncbi:MAG: transporter substrate-binding domain-containing protein [Alphaproteobacteria bacterium]